MSATYQNFIGGEWMDGVSGNWLQKRKPADLSEAGRLVDSDLMDVVRSVQAANKALATWTKTTREQRAEILLKIASSIEDRAADFARAIASDLGVAESATLKYSVPVAVDHFRAHAWSIAPTIATVGSAPMNPTASDGMQPVGLVAAIIPSSDPLACLASRVAPALAHANAIIVKVSRHTPATGALFAEIVRDSGLPPGAMNLLHGRGSEVGEAIVRHPGISTISFQGSTETARIIALSAADAFKKMHYSMGAKNPVLLFANTDLAVAIPQVAQICLGVHPSQAFKGSRLFIQEGIFKSALELLKKEIDSTPISCVVKPEQFKAYESAIQLALKENGKVVTTGGENKITGQQVKPYLFADLTNCSTLQQEEIAGPLILATSFKYQHEALKHANVSPYGRVGFIFENDEDKAMKVAQKLEAGSIFTNTAEIRFDPLEEIPLFKNSGFHPEGGFAIARFFTRTSKVFSSDT